MRALLLPAAAGGFSFLILGVFLRHLKRAPFRPLLYLVPAALAVFLLLAADANEWPRFYGNYSTTQPLTDFHGDYALSLAIRVLLAGSGVLLASYVLDVFLHLLQGNRLLRPFSLPLAVAIVVLGAGAQRLLLAIEALVPGERLSSAMWSPPPVETWSPALAVFLNAGLAAVVGSLLLSLAVTAILVVFSSPHRLWYALALAICWGLSHAGSAPLFAFHAISLLAMLALAVVVVRAAATGVATLAGAIFLASMFRGAIELWQQPHAAYQTGAWVLVAIAGIVSAAAGLLGRPRD